MKFIPRFNASIFLSSVRRRFRNKEAVSITTTTALKRRLNYAEGKLYCRFSKLFGALKRLFKRIPSNSMNLNKPDA